ncbi:MAG: hypothetical protein GY864_00360 [Desulfobacterales bacterium]|nr:hypothetical protein [Desulfobacterales bacterium]
MNNYQRIEFNTGMNDFLPIDSISQAGPEEIIGAKSFTNSPVYVGLEALAQLGGYHVRYLTRFERHAFLLKINRCMLPGQSMIDGGYTLYGALLSQSMSAFSYNIQAKKGDEIKMQGEFLYATIDYDDNFKKDILQEYYQKAFSCLTTS